MITLVLADDHPLILAGLKQLLAQEPDFRVLAECATGEEAVNAVRQHRPAVLVLDLRLSGKDGLSVLRELREEDGLPTRVVVLTAALDEGQLVEALHLGARGVVLKEMAPRFLLQCLRKVHAGGQWYEMRSLGRLTGLAGRAEALTRREMEIVRRVAQGLNNRAIAESLAIGEGTVKVHLHRIYEKLKVRNRVEVLLHAREKGWV
ncbi:MAG: response regulator [Gammaproteobacteria bacterium]